MNLKSKMIYFLIISICFLSKIGLGQNLNFECVCKTLYQFNDTLDCSKKPLNYFVEHEYLENGLLIISTGKMQPYGVNFENFVPRKLIKDTFRVEKGIIRPNLKHEVKPIFSPELFLKKDTTYYFNTWLYGFLNILYINKYEYVPIKKTLINGVVSYKYWMTKTVFALNNGNEINKDSLIYCLYNYETLDIPIIEEPLKNFLYFIPDCGFLVDDCLENENTQVYFKHWIEIGDCKKYLRGLFLNWY